MAYDESTITYMIRSEIIEIEPLFAYVLYPKCVWYGFCPLLYRGCGLSDEAIKEGNRIFVNDIKEKSKSW